MAIFCVLMIFNALPAKEKSQFFVETSMARTSDGLSLDGINLVYRNHRRELIYPYKDEEDKAFDYGLKMFLGKGKSNYSNFEHLRLLAFVGYKLSKHWYFETGSGLSNIKVKLNNKSSSAVPGYIKTEFLRENFYWNIAFQKRFTISDLRYPNAVRNLLKTKRLTNNLLWTPGKFRFKLQNRSENLSDSNDALYQDFEIKYNLSNGPYWMLLGVGLERYQNEKEVEGYWTPNDFKSYGLRFEIYGPIYKNYKCFMALNLNRLKDSFDKYGKGYYLNVGIQSNNRDNTNFKIGFERVQSRQDKNNWYMDRPYIQYNYFW
jgi:hypothetical protein